MTKTSLHFALIVCDTPLPEVIERYGDYTKQYPVVFDKAAKGKDLAITWDFFNVVDEGQLPSLEDVKAGKYDAIVVTGSKHNAHDNTPWILKLVDFLATVQTEPYQKAVKLIGFCFGHQTILRSAGGVTERNPKGWEVGYTEIELNSSGKEFFNTDKNKLRINQLHRDHVSTLPKGFKCLAFTKENTENHITVSDNKQVITVQGHPEFNRGTMRIVIEKRMESGILPKEQATQWLKTLDDLKTNEDMEDVWLVEKFIDFTFSEK